MATLRPLVAGNWKMNGLRNSLSVIAGIADAVASGAAGRAEVAVCPPFTLLAAAAELARGTPPVPLLGGQDCHPAGSGPYTGDISAEMLKDSGALLVIVGHSERRAGHAETDAIVRAKAEAAARAGLLAIICVGETRAERDGGETLRVIGRQIDESVPPGSNSKSIVIAYEPVWAIGTGLVPSPDDVAEVHAFIRRRVAGQVADDGDMVRLLYGGSVKPANARDFTTVANVNGVLVGGASLAVDDFMGIASAYA